MVANIGRTGPFIPRVSELLALEGQYGDITLSCRHRDILRCSQTKHFTSCFRPDGINAHEPYHYCYHPEVCIIYKRDRAGAFVARCFGFYDRQSKVLKLCRMYGNGMSHTEVSKKLKSHHPELRVWTSDTDVYLSVLD